VSVPIAIAAAIEQRYESQVHKRQ